MEWPDRQTTHNKSFTTLYTAAPGRGHNTCMPETRIPRPSRRRDRERRREAHRASRGRPRGRDLRQSDRSESPVDASVAVHRASGVRSRAARRDTAPDRRPQLLAGLMGHNLCLDIFGGPSDEEAAAGLSVHGEASVAPYEIECGAEARHDARAFPRNRSSGSSGASGCRSGGGVHRGGGEPLRHGPARRVDPARHAGPAVPREPAPRGSRLRPRAPRYSKRRSARPTT
jgi:hypothetical protein